MTGVSHVSFMSLPVTDQDRALAFWRDVMGFVVTTNADHTPGMRWIMLRPAEARTQIHLDKVEAMPPQGEKPVLPLEAPDVPEIVARLRSHGVEIVKDPGPAPWNAEVTYAMFNDSEGNLILLSSSQRGTP